MKRFSQLFSTALVSFLLSSCGGGGGSQVAEGGIGGTGVSAGRVTQVGSIYVNGIYYNTDTATFTVDDISNPSLSDVSVGMVVKVTGTKNTTSNTGVAESVTYSSLLIGPVDCAFDPVDCPDTLSAMGQTISTNADTVYDDSTGGRPNLVDLQIDDVIEVSGFTNGTDGILATRIESENSSERKVSGQVIPVDATSFKIERLIVNISGTGLGLPAADSYVEVHGNSDPNPSTLEFVPTLIESLDTGDGTIGDDGEEVDFEGQITTARGNITGQPNQFIVNGQTVEIQIGITEYEGGSETDLATEGRIVEVEGVMDGSILIADEIEFEATSEEKSEIAGELGIDNVDENANTITLLDTVIQIDNTTILEDDSGTSSTFTLADLISSDFIEANVYDNNGVLTASKLERESLPTGYTAALEGTPTLVSGDIVILGIIIYPGTTGYTFNPGDRIEVKGTYNAGILFATSIDIDN